MIPADSPCTMVVADGVLTISGEVTTQHEAEFEEAVSAILDTGTGKARMDLSGVTYIDSSCVRTLAKAKERGVKLCVVASAKAMRLLVAAGIDTLGDITVAGEGAPGSH
jgi:anti-anti-sigma factor